MDKNKGFSLVEIAIVLVVVGLIVAGVLGGQSLIANAERNALVKEFQKYSGALGTFRLQYNQLPGDMDNATSYWSSATNGDGNGSISGYSTECSNGLNQHLKFSEIVAELDVSSAGVKSSIKNGIFTICNSLADLNTNYFSLTASYSVYDKVGNYLMLGGANATHGYAIGGVLDAENAQFVDKKLDDGKASSGILSAIRGGTGSALYTTGCVDSANFTTASTEGTINYDLTNEAKNCRLIYWLSHLD